MDSVLTALVAATRPYVPFSFEINGKEFNLFCRRLSAAESATCNQVYNDEYNTALEDLEREDSSDLAAMRRTFEKQKKERLIEFILQAEREEFLAEASSEMDDLPFTDTRVVTRANEIQERAKGFYLNAPDEEILDKALQKRAYIYAAIRASGKRNIQIIFFSTYQGPDEVNKPRAFSSAEEISDELDITTIDMVLSALARALGEQKTDPLKSAVKKSSSGRTKSPKTSVAV